MYVLLWHSDSHISSSVKHCDCSCMQNLNALLEHVGLFATPGHKILFQYNQLMYELKCVIQKNYIKYGTMNSSYTICR